MKKKKRIPLNEISATENIFHMLIFFQLQINMNNILEKIYTNDL